MKEERNRQPEPDNPIWGQIENLVAETGRRADDIWSEFKERKDRVAREHHAYRARVDEAIRDYSEARAVPKERVV